MDWNPAQYERYKAERAAPFFDLLALVEPRPGMRVADLGCGTGALTAELHRRLPDAATLGLDSSPAMLAEAQAHRAPGLRFAQGDIADFAADGGGARYDLIFSNAALQWLPDHPALLSRLAARLRPGGQLAVQVPANHDHPAQTVAAELARQAPYADALGGWERSSPVLPPEEYAALLDRLGCGRQQVRLQVYGHRLPDCLAAADWSRGTVLLDYERRLGEAEFAQFYAEYRRRLAARLGDARPYFFAFKRILMWGAID